MTRADIESEMVIMQKQMLSLQLKEADAYKRKAQAEQEIMACGASWSELYHQYQEMKLKLSKINQYGGN